MISFRITPFTSYLTSIVYLTALSSFSINTLAGEDKVFHVESESSCTEIRISQEDFKIFSFATSIYLKGECSDTNSQGNKKLVGCKDLSTGESTWYYDVPGVYDMHMLHEVKKDCDEWLTADS